MKLRNMIVGALASASVFVSIMTTETTVANATSYFDGDFLAANVTSSYVLGSTSDATIALPCASCGVGSTAGFQVTTLTANNAGIFVGETNWVYDPTTQGSIVSISGSIDRGLFVPGTPNNNAVFRLAIEQSGNIYFASIFNAVVVADGTYHTLSGTGLTAANFGLFTAGGFATPGSQHPDFTQPFEFGYLTLFTANVGAISSFDNLSIEVTSTPLPAALPLFATGLGLIGLLARRRKQRHAAPCVGS
jgi:hypothetical protein